MTYAKKEKDIFLKVLLIISSDTVCSKSFPPYRKC